MHDDYDGFGVRVLEENGKLMAQFIDFPEVAACGTTVVAALIELKAVWEATKEIYIYRGLLIIDGRQVRTD